MTARTPSSMTCPEARMLIVETLSGTSPPDLRLAVEAHLASCAACRAEAAAAEGTVRALRGGPEGGLQPEQWETFMARLEERMAAERRHPWERLRHWLRHPRHAWSAAAAAATGAVALAAALVGPARPPGPPAHVPDSGSALVREFISPRVVDGLPGLRATLAVWRAGLNGEDASEGPVEGR